MSCPHCGSPGPPTLRPGDRVPGLTAHQSAMAWAVAEGLANKELADRFGIAEGTVKNTLHRIYERLAPQGVTNRLTLLLYLRGLA